MAPGQLFDESMYRYDEAQPSWWEASAPGPKPKGKPLSGSQSCDVAIIGGGYTGASAALHLARDFNVDVRVLEAGHFGWGASGRNGGFVTMGGTFLSAKTQISRFGLEETRKYFQHQKEAVELVHSLGQNEKIDFQPQGDAELVVAEKPAHFEALKRDAEIEREALGIDSFMISKEEFAEKYYDAPHQHGAMAQKPCFGLHPLRYAQGLAVAAERHGAKLHPSSEVTSWRKENGQHILETAAGKLTAKKVIVACNGFMPEHLHSGLKGRAMPLQSLIVVTRPLTGDELAAHNWQTECTAINSRNVYFYYRMLPDNRLLLGGRADTTGTVAGAKQTASDLTDYIGQLWPHWKGIEIEYSWRGFVCFTSELHPSIGRMPEDLSVYFGFGYHGNGVNNATWTGRELARWMVQGNSPDEPRPLHLPPQFHGMTYKIPFARLRSFYGNVAVGWYRMKDRLDGIR